MARPGVAAFFVVLCLACASGVAHCEQMPATTLRASVKNNTADGTPVADDEAVLELYRDAESWRSLRGTVGADGQAVFADVPTGPRVAGVVRVKHQNMVFKSRPVSLADATKEVSVTVHVFDVSTDRSQLSVSTHHVVIAVNSTSLEFEEYMLLENNSDVAIRGTERDETQRPVVIDFRLPKGFRDLTASGYLEQEALVVTSTGFHDTLAVPPGQHHISFSYAIGIDRPTMDIIRGISVATSELTIFWKRGRGTLEGLGQPDDRLVNAEGTPVEYYRRNNLSPGDTVAFRLSGFNVQQSDKRTWIILAGVFAAALAVALLRTRSRSTPKRRMK